MRATAHAAEQARRTAGRSPTIGNLLSAEILAGIEAALAPAEPVESTPGVDSTALLADMGRTIDGQSTAPAARAANGLASKSSAESTAPASASSPSRRLALFGGAAGLLAPLAPRPAMGLPGVLAKAKAYLDSNSYDVLYLAELADSLAEDMERVLEGKVAA